MQRLEPVRIPKAKILLPWAACVVLGFLLCWAYFVFFLGKSSKSLDYEQLIVLTDDAENELVSPKAIYEFMKEVGIKHPEIVWSQVALESRFNSRICLENHNYFGMKRATNRPNMQNGENLDHATYRNWKMSVLDYALWQSSTGVWKIKSERAYLNYLDQTYAEDSSYGLKVKEIRDNFEHYLELYEKKFKKGLLTNK